MKKLFTILFATLLVCFSSAFSAAFSAGNAKADDGAATKYDISEVTTLSEGEVSSVKQGTKYVGNKAIGYGETVSFGYKNVDSSQQLRMAFGIGYYGFYLYYDPDKAVTVMSCDMSGWSRKTNIATVSRDLFNDYNEIELCLTQKDEQNVHLEMTYSDGEERKLVGVDFAIASASDGLFRYGDMKFNGNKVKSLLPAPVFGNGFTYDCENVAGENQYGGCGFAVVSKENASAKGVPSGFTSDFVLIASSATSSFDMSFDFSSLRYKRKHISGVSFRLYMEKNAADSASYPELRIPDGNGGWIFRKPVGTQTGQWITVSLESEAIDKLCPNGILGKFVFGVRANGVAKMFIDSINVETLPPDTVAPVINAAVTRFKTTEGTYPTLDYITVTDDSGACDVTYTWSEGALDFNGRLSTGNHTCTITAIDGWDNVTTVVIYYEVEAETPVEKYTITFRCEGKEDKTFEYSVDTVDYVVAPDDLPERKFYNADWGDYSLGFTRGQIVTAVYTPIVYTVTYMADGKKVGEVTYTIENYDFDIPAVPKKKGYDGEWEPHEFTFENITVNAVYTKIEEPDNSETGSSSEISESLGSAESSDSSGGKGENSGNSGNDKKGCASSVSAVAPLVSVLIAAVGAVSLKRKKDE